MAIGDYTKTSYANGGAPAISAANLNHAEDKIDELDAWAGTVDPNITVALAGTAPAGSMSMYAGASIPTGWLLCDGQAVSRSTYSALFTAISTTWGIGNGSTTFNVPDMREASPYGAGTYSAVTGTTHGAITAHDAKTLGTFGDDQAQGHRNAAQASGAFITYNAGTLNRDMTAGSGTSYNLTSTGDPVTDGTNGTPRTGTTTRGKIIGINFIIKY